MITVKLYGLLRLNSGIKELSADATSLRELTKHLEAKGLSASELSGCNVIINGKPAGKRTPLKDGDIVQFFPPVAGG